MNGKFILVFMVILNLSALFLNFSCNNSDAVFCGNIQGSLISQLFNLNSNTDITDGGGLAFSDNFSDAVSGITRPEGGSFIGVAVSVFLDGLKMALGIISFLTPIPMLDVLNSLGAPIYIIAIIGIPLIVIYIITIAEFIRGAPFGSQ